MCECTCTARRDRPECGTPDGEAHESCVPRDVRGLVASAPPRLIVPPTALPVAAPAPEPLRHAGTNVSMITTVDADDALYDAAYSAFDDGRLAEASALFARMLEGRPDAAELHYMRGLAHKYLRDWSVSLAHNLRALELDGFDEAAAWNAGIAATALGDWDCARRLWRECGIALPEGQGPVEGDFGLVSIRLNPWGAGETVWARRIDVVRARLLNVPLPESGYRFGDIVLHDGASTGGRRMGERTAPVFNALQRLQKSDFRTFVAFVSCDSAHALEPLLEARAPGLGYVEDWTGSVAHYCLRCSHGTPHRHADDEAPLPWKRDRSLGIAAQGRRTAEKLLRD